jgi:hypothetical protein
VQAASAALNHWRVLKCGAFALRDLRDRRGIFYFFWGRGVKRGGIVSGDPLRTPLKSGGNWRILIGAPSSQLVNFELELVKNDLRCSKNRELTKDSKLRPSLHLTCQNLTARLGFHILEEDFKESRSVMSLKLAVVSPP